MLKILFIIIDGLGDEAIEELGGKTPLEAARTPHFDFLAKNGICGLIEPVFEKKFPTSVEGHLSLFGYDPREWKVGRGVFEALGLKMKLLKNDLALRGNFATVDKNLKIIDRRAGRIEETLPLIKALSEIRIERIKFFFGKGISHRIALVLRGKNLSEEISPGDYHQIGIPAPKIYPLKKDKKAKFTAKILNEFLKKSHQILKEHPLNKKRIKKGLLPANFILLRGAGKFKKLPSFKKKWGMKSCAIAGGILYKGIARALGMEILEVKGATGRFDTNLKGKFKKARDALKNYDFCYLHIKAPDNFSHDGDFKGKRDFLEKIDKNLALILELRKVLIIITGDHSTSSRLKEHSPLPVPVLVFGQAKKDKEERFFEKACQKGGLGKIKSIDFLKKVVKMKL